MMNNSFRIRAFSLASAVIMACHLPSARAEAKAVEIRPGDSLSRIVAAQYPDYSIDATIMQFVLDKNPQAFINNDINRLVVGKVLILPDAADIPAAKPLPAPQPAPAAPSTAVATSSIDQQKLQELEQALQTLQAERNQSDANLTQLRQENSELRSKLATAPAITAPTIDTTATENLRVMEQERDELRSRLQQLEAEKSERANQQDSLAFDKQQLNEQIRTLEAKVAALTADKEAIIAAARSSIPATGDGSEPSRADMDMAALNQQLDLIANANVQLQSEKDALQKERDELSARLNELATNKETSSTPDTDTNSNTAQVPDQAAMDLEILNQQLDTIESANVQLQAEKDSLKKERDELNARLNELAASKEAANTVPTDTKPEPDQAAMDLEILTQQLDAIESANVQLQSEKDTLQKELDIAKQQLASPQPVKDPTKDNTASAQSSDQSQLLQQLQQELDKAQQALTLANAAKANAELARAKLEKSGSGSSLWPWLLALLLAPLAWFLGRNTVHPLPQKPAPTTTHTPATVTTPPPTITTTVPAASQQQNVDGLLADEEQVVAAEAAEGLGSQAYPATAANDDNPDAAIKLDIVRAYLDLRDSASAQPILNEVLREGGRQQRQEAREILSFLS